jgi:hypothetical protein
VREGESCFGRENILVVYNVEFNGSMEDITSYESKVAIDGALSATEKGPGAAGVIRELKVGVLEERDCDYREQSVQSHKRRVPL